MPQHLPHGSEIVIKDSKNDKLNFIGAYSVHAPQNEEPTRTRLGYVKIETPDKVTIEVTGFSEERILSFEENGLKLFLKGFLGGGVVWLLFMIFSIYLIVSGARRVGKNKQSNKILGENSDKFD